MSDSETPPRTNIDHVTNSCTDVDRTKALYEAVPGSQFVELTEGE